MDLAAEPPVGPQAGSLVGPGAPQRILEEVGCDEDTITRVCEIVRRCHAGEAVDCIEFRIVRDADTLASLSSQVLTTTPDQWTDVIDNRLFTAAAKEWARKWSQTPQHEHAPQGGAKQ
jgi:hypothetical protein